MRKEPVEQKELRFPARDGTAYARQIMQLSEGAGEGGFTALVRAAYYKDALLPFQRKIIADHGRFFDHEFVGQGQIKPFIVMHVLPCIRNVRITEFQSRSFDSRDILQIGKVKLYFAVK